MSEKQPHSEQTHQLEALSKERLMKFYEIMLHKALDYRKSCDEATDAELQDSLSEWEEESDIPISDFAVFSWVFETTRTGYERPQLVTTTYQGDPVGIMDIGGPSSVFPPAIFVSINLNVEDRVANDLLPTVGIEVAMSGQDSPEDKKRLTQKRLRLTIDEHGAVVGNGDFVQSRSFGGTRPIYLSPSAAGKPQGEGIAPEEINATIDQCLSMVETILK